VKILYNEISEKLGNIVINVVIKAMKY